ncbi:MAG: SIMPL domain-containing protein [Candidatus Cloacimonadota bacterium]|nr:SIMPL domain-containing protein [Candidatus Cloacimonadota bacterium]
MIRTLRVTGQSSLVGKPDTFVISFPVSVINKSYSTAIIQLNEKVNTLRNVLFDNDLDKSILKTSSFSVRRETEYDSKRKTYYFVGYKASHETRIEHQIDKELMNKLLNDLSLKMQDLEFDVSFLMKDSKIFLEKLLQKAISNAKHNAEIIAKASGVKLKEIVDINYSFNELHIIESNSRVEYLSEAVEYAPDIEPEYVEADKTITINWRIE